MDPKLSATNSPNDSSSVDASQAAVPVERVEPSEIAATSTSHNVPRQVTPAMAVSNASNGEGLASNYVASELRHARKSLLTTQIVGSLLTLGTLLYMGYIVSTLNRSLEPQAAAEIASGAIGERVETQAVVLSEQVKERLPQMIAQLPDYALQQMPQYRENLESQIESDLMTHSQKAADELGGHFDDFLGAHKDEIKATLDGAQDSQAVKQVGAQLEQEFLKSLKKIDAGNGETAQVKIDKTLVALKEINSKMQHLANAKNLTPQEKKARRAIALMTSSVNHHTKDVAGAVNSMTSTMSSSLDSTLNSTSSSETSSDSTSSSATSSSPEAASSDSSKPDAAG